VVDEERAEQCDDGNLDPGDGCSPRCFWEPTAAATAVDGVGNQKTECVIGWRAEGIIGAKQESPTPRRRCVDGNPACDRDGAVNGECAFWVWLCSNTTQLADLPCHPSAGRDGVGTVAIAQVRKPSAKHASRRSVDAGNHRLLLEAAAAAAVGENIDVCGPRLTIRIPLRASERRGWRSIRVKATTNQNVIDTDSLKLICVAPEAPTLEAEVTPPSAPAGRLAPMREVTEPSE
jgi:cysteine-rich repeat protein